MDVASRKEKRKARGSAASLSRGLSWGKLKDMTSYPIQKGSHDCPSPVGTSHQACHPTQAIHSQQLLQSRCIVHGLLWLLLMLLIGREAQ
jgi:hypothetical protein